MTVETLLTIVAVSISISWLVFLVFSESIKDYYYRYFTSESDVVKMLRGEKIQRGDIVITDYGDSVFYHVVLKNNVEQEVLICSLISSDQVNISTPGYTDVIFHHNGVNGHTKESYKKLNKHDNIYKFQIMKSLRICFSLERGSRSLEVETYRPEVRRVDG